MDMGELDTAASCFRSAYNVRLADTPSLVREAFRLRHQVYCRERGYEPDRGGLETDEFDGHARHAVVCNQRNGEVVGTVRLILPITKKARSLPMHQICQTRLLDGLPAATTGEVSRFAVSRERRSSGTAADPLLRLGLVQGLVRMSRDAGVTHWCAVLERSLLRLLRMTAIHFLPVGPCVEFHGLRQPAVAHVGGLMARMEQEQPAVWSFVTDGGRHWPRALQYSAAAQCLSSISLIVCRVL